VRDVFLRDRQTGTTERLSVGLAGAQANADSLWTGLSGDARFVTFESRATNLVPGDTGSTEDVFVYDRVSGTTECVSVDSTGTRANADCWAPTISADGRFVTFYSEATNLVSDDTNGRMDAFVHGPYLTLEAEPADVAPDEAITLTTWTGQPSGLALLAVVGVDGMPLFIPAALSTFDGAGVWSFSDTAPPGLSGIEMALQSFGFVPTGKAQGSNSVTVTFQ
jgi:hypothetical protein